MASCSSLRRTSPASAVSKPAKILIKVVLPIPDGPTILSTSPSATDKFNALKIVFVLYVFVNCLISNIAYLQLFNRVSLRRKRTVTMAVMSK